MGHTAELTLGMLKELKSLLLEEGYSHLSLEMNNLIYAIENEDFNTFKRHYKSRLILGGAGSLRDLDFRDDNKNELLDKVLKGLKDYYRKTRKPFWRYW